MDIKKLDFKERTINLFGDITEDSVKDTIEKIVNINIADTEYVNSVAELIGCFGFGVKEEQINLPPIIINLSTFGGEVYSGFGLCDSIYNSETSINIICYGKIMSMGIPILLSGKYKVAHKNTTFMIHDLSSLTCGKLGSMEEDLNELKRLQQMYINYICANSKFPRKKLEQIFSKKQDYFFGVEEALKYKIIDEIIN